MLEGEAESPHLEIFKLEQPVSRCDKKRLAEDLSFVFAMDLPPPSQSQAQKSTLFSNADGTPIRVFTQADLQGRNRVLKDLRVCFVPLVMVVV